MIGRAAAIFVGLALIAEPALAHEFRPAILDLRDLGDHRYEAAFSASAEGALSISAPEDCAREAENRGRSVLRCARADLAGRAITVRGLGPTHADVLVRFEGPEGVVTAVLRADSPTFVVPSRAITAPLFARAKTYFSAGIAHIAEGVDHLSFVLGLLLLVRGAAGVARAVTAFTLAHSLTLALAVTAKASLPPAPVEAVIALSLVLLAREIARPEGAEATLARRSPASIAFAFGLLHGFGFAGGLTAMRVPQADLPLALAGWNLGIEAGQLAFVAVALAAMALIRPLVRADWRPKLALVPAYFIGSMGAFFALGRLSRLWRS